MLVEMEDNPMVVFDTNHAEKQGRLAMREQILADVRDRIATLTHSINVADHKKTEKIALQVTRRAFQVLCERIEQME
jgi:hypothetical protein